jgi:hypothetical protein
LDQKFESQSREPVAKAAFRPKEALKRIASLPWLFKIVRRNRMTELKLLSAGLIAAAMLGTPDHGTETPSERASRRKRR